jgi:pimeloyl-ACP methyl ester carboxylesterase
MNAPPPISERRASETTGGAMMLIRLRCAVLAVALGACAPSALCQDLIVAKRIFELPSYSTVGNATIRNLKIGWEAAGTLNADKSNAILITHFFSGTSHAFGKYAAGDNAAGYWDSIIGPGKPIDTDKYYVISSDTLVNLNVNAPNVMTTGPASIDPGTGKPYGMSFPVVSIKDFVRVQKALIDSLGVKKLKAVVGASMGGLQAYEWAASYPEMVERIIPVIATPGPDLYLIASWAPGRNPSCSIRNGTGETTTTGSRRSKASRPRFGWRHCKPSITNGPTRPFGRGRRTRIRIRARPGAINSRSRWSSMR